MSVNRERPHILVIPEDDANRQLANGFFLGVDPPLQRQMQVLDVAGGWVNVLDSFESTHVDGMGRYKHRFIILLLDFDGRTDRLEIVKRRIPEGLSHRVFVFGSRTTPEDLRAALGPYETIGSALADDCRNNTVVTWSHPTLEHNLIEHSRSLGTLRNILFQA